MRIARLVIAIVLLLALLGFGVKSLLDGHRLTRAIEGAQCAKLVDAPVDLSSPGQFVLPLRQTFSGACRETIALRVPDAALPATSAAQLLAGLEATLEITDSSGKAQTIDAEEPRKEKIDGAIPIFYLHVGREGDYVATVTVRQGAPSLRGVPQRLEGRYLLCGLERMGAALNTLVGVVCLVVAGIVGAVTAICVARARRRRLHPASAILLPLQE